MWALVFLSSELLQVGPRDKTTLSIPFHSPPAVLSFQDDHQNVSRRNVQLIGILGKKWPVSLSVTSINAAHTQSACVLGF
ncbi:hypothetical protein LEMLEM_LOCUS22884 [Lemmus lemmus]